MKTIKSSRKGALGIALAAIFAAGLGTTEAAYTFADFGASAYNADTATMDAALGVAGYQVEDFEDTTLHPDLTLTGWTPGGSFDPNQNNAGEAWDGNRVFSFYAVNDANPGALNFIVAGGAASVGFALSSWHYPNLDANDPQRPNRLRINGGAWIDIDNTNFPNLDIVGNGRAGYLRIDQGAGDAPITVLELSDPGDESLRIDHVTWNPVPEPSTFVLAALGLMGLFGRRRRH